MATVPALAYVPVALVTRLPDGQLVVLHGQSTDVETSMDLDRRTDGYTTTVEWRPGKMAQTRLPDYCPGVKLHDDNGVGGPLFHPEPLMGQDENAELRARVAQLEAAGRAMCDAYEREPPTVYDETAAAHNEFRAVLYGNAIQ